MDILGLAPPHQYVWPPHCPPNTQVLEPPLFLKAVSDAALVMSAGRLFHKVGAATLKARLP